MLPTILDTREIVIHIPHHTLVARMRLLVATVLRLLIKKQDVACVVIDSSIALRTRLLQIINDQGAPLSILLCSRSILSSLE